MSKLQFSIAEDCTQRSLAGTITFPEVVGILIANGLESYHADLQRLEKTYYMPSNASHIVPFDLAHKTVAARFSHEDVRAAIAAIQSQDIIYKTFLERIMDAGCAHYWVYLQGKCAVYVGRDGQQHVEPFPAGK